LPHNSTLKRSILFGALGCVWAAFLVFFTFTNSLADIPSIHDQAYHIDDYRVISAAWFMFEAFGLDAALGLSFLLTLLVWLLILRRFAFVGRRRISPHRDFIGWFRDMGGMPGVMMRAASVVVAGYCILLLPDFGSSLLDLHVIPFYSFGFVKGLFVLTLLEAGPLVFIVFTFISFTHIVFSKERIIGIIKGISVPVAGVAAFFAATGAAWFAAGNMGVYDTLSDAPGITSTETHDTLYVLMDDPVEHTIALGFPELLITSPRFGDEAPFNLSFCEQNESAVCRYLQGHGGRGVQALSAYDYLFSYRIRRLDMPGLMDTLVAAWEDTGEPVYWNLCLAWITKGAKSEYRYGLLRRITDESKYSIPGRSAIKVSGAYAKYREMERARYWYDKGVSTGRRFTQRDMEVYKPGTVPPFSEGKIKGSLSVPDGVNVSGAGIIPAASMPYYPYISDDVGRTRHLTMSVSDAVSPAPEGGFEFDGLPAGEYYIILSVPGDGGLSVTNPPGVITISEEKPAVDVGTIELKKVVRFPDAEKFRSGLK